MLDTSPFKSVLLALLLLICSTASADDVLKPFVLAASIAGGDISSVSKTAREKLSSAGFDVIGEYAPYEGANILVISNQPLRDLASKSVRGGYGAALRVSITSNDGNIELSYTNPLYWANAYRMQAGVDAIAEQLKSALGYEKQFGSGELSLGAEDLRKYHYTFMMEYFDDPSLLNYFDSHQQAVATVRKNLADRVSASTQVFELPLAPDSEGKPMTLFGVGLVGADQNDCSSDRYIMGKIDKSSPRHSAHLPYEILVYGDRAEALFGRFRIAISWPHLPMMASDTGATFFSIMCAPGAIEDALMQIAGGSRISSGDEK
ncbi:MAG: hypothetical protein OEU50_18690 [Gammaproteobacteria bacterium]|nr:hypothetical protein [Gammaproteobacteria bacterium]